MLAHSPTTLDCLPALYSLSPTKCCTQRADPHGCISCVTLPLTSMAMVCAAVTKLRAFDGGDSGRLPMGGRSHQQPSVGAPPLKVAACRCSTAAGESPTGFLPLFGWISLHMYNTIWW